MVMKVFQPRPFSCLVLTVVHTMGTELGSPFIVELEYSYRLSTGSYNATSIPRVSLVGSDLTAVTFYPLSEDQSGSAHGCLFLQ